MGTNHRSERRRRAATRLSLVAAGLLLTNSGADVAAQPAPDAEPAAALPTATSTTVVGDAVGAYPTVSGDGRFVAFHGAPVVSEGSTDGRQSTVYLTDRETGVTTELTPVPAGLRSGDSVYPVIADDGCSVVAVSEMSLDVFRDNDAGDRWDVYRSTLPHCGGTVGDWELVSTRPDSGGLARDDAAVAPPTVSRGGTTIAYTHPADHLFGADGITTVSLVDLTFTVDDPRRTRFVSGSPADSPTNSFIHRGLDQPVISGDGRYLAYRSDATSAEAVPGWATGVESGGPATPQVYVWEIAEADPFLAVRLVSALDDGAPVPEGASEPDISRDGMRIAFVSSSSSLVPATYPSCTTDCPTQVFVLDRDSDRDGKIGTADRPELTLVSAREGGAILAAGGGPSTQPSISPDGQLVAFVTKASDLLLIEPSGFGGGDDGDLLLAEVGRGDISRLTNLPGGVVPTRGVHAHPDLSDSGRTAVFDSGAAVELLGGDKIVGRQIVARTSEPSLSLADADLGTTLVNVESDEWYVAVINDGPSSFRPTKVTMSDSRFSINEEKSSCLFASSVPSGGSCTVAVTFKPTGPGAAAGTLTVLEEGFGGVSVSSQIRGEGGNPALRITPAGIELGAATVGEPSTEMQFDLTNIAFSPAYISSFEITGANAAEFSFTTNNCVDRPVNPRASCSVGITFTPADEGRRTALAELTTDLGQYTTVLLEGDGEFAPELTVDTTEVRAGGSFIAAGSNYPPNTEVSVVFGDGAQSSTTVITDAEGDFLAVVPVDFAERGGDRRVVVQSTSGATASQPLRVIETDSSYIGMAGFGLG